MINSRLKIVAFVSCAFVLGAFAGGTMVKLKAPHQRVSSEREFVTGIGGVFFKVKDPKKTREWYKEYLGIFGEGQGVNFYWRDRNNPDLLGFTVWSVFPRDSDYFGPNGQEFMINYRVRDLNRLLARLEKQGIQKVGEIQEYSYGRFAWIVDDDGKRVELWEPVYSSSNEVK